MHKPPLGGAHITTPPSHRPEDSANTVKKTFQAPKGFKDLKNALIKDYEGDSQSTVIL